MATGEVIVAPRGGDVVANDFKAIFSVDQALERKAEINRFIREVLEEGEDYGVIPGSEQSKDGKPRKVLFKPGAEKMSSIFALTPRYSLDDSIEDWTGETHGGEQLFSYSYRCQLYRGDRFMGESVANCNSWESKYRYRWVREELVPPSIDKTRLLSRGGKRVVFEPNFAIDRAETGGKYGKPPEYWQKFRDAIKAGAPETQKKLGAKEHKGYEVTIDEVQFRIPNPDVADVINTCKKISQKRAYVSAILSATNCSDAFTPDLEDFEDLKSGHAATVPRQEGSGSISSGGELFDDGDPSPQGAPPVPTASQSPQQGQQKASQAQFEQKQQTRERPIPEELSAMFKSIDESTDRDARVKAIDSAFRVMQGSFESLNSPDAMKEHDDIKAAFRDKFPRGKGKQVGNMDFKFLLLDLWDGYRRWEQHLGVSSGSI